MQDSIITDTRDPIMLDPITDTHDLITPDLITDMQDSIITDTRDPITRALGAVLQLRPRRLSAS
jgi:hypothetical protein